MDLCIDDVVKVDTWNGVWTIWKLTKSTVSLMPLDQGARLKLISERGHYAKQICVSARRTFLKMNRESA
jgi:hypothetical protein